MIGFLCFALAAGILVGFSTEQLDTSGRPHGVGVLLRQKRDNANDRSALQNSEGKSRFLLIIDHFLSEALRSNEAQQEEIRKKLLLASRLRETLLLTRRQLLEIPRQTTDEQKLHVTMKMLGGMLFSSDSLEAAVQSSNSDFVRSVTSTIYWICQSILTYDFTKKDEINCYLNLPAVSDRSKKFSKPTQQIDLIGSDATGIVVACMFSINSDVAYNCGSLEVNRNITRMNTNFK
ncbi:hypothetical protein Q1695_004505 [Nippostrongylus brasiliensis]|nr:hypothetical protein Q1695_004505 [Nippostrongylus brasiliensis]